MPKAQDLSDKRFGKLIAINLTGEIRKNQGKMWHCLCDCGNTTEVSCGVLNSGAVKSCGCLRVDVGTLLGKGRFKHGEGHGRKTKEYRTWTSMKERCLYEKHPNYSKYGGRGIVICDTWKHSYVTFLNDMGRAEIGQSIERKDVNGPYSPENCVWSDSKTQCRNKTNTRYMEVGGVKRKAIEIADELGVGRNSIYTYLKIRKLLEGKYGKCC